MSAYTVDIDIGGTFTDGLIADGSSVWSAKALTTPHDLTEGLLECLGQAAGDMRLPLKDLLRRTRVLRLSTTLGTNCLVQRSGPRLGLLVTAGHEADLYGAGPASAIDLLVLGEMVVGLREAVDDRGGVEVPLDGEAVLAAVRRLVTNGARMIIVSFSRGWVNPVHERAVREWISERYPVHYLRSVPLQLASEVSHTRDDHARTTTALLNAYLHPELHRGLYRAEERLREMGLGRPLLVVHAHGGSARVAKTTAVETLHSGPAVALMGAAFLARLDGLPRVVTADMGGTSFDVGLIVNAEPTLQLQPSVNGLRLALPMLEVESMGAGGGSIARMENGRLRVGPESAGALPGPACYDRGGSEPTVTDANVVLGLIDPDYFLGGRLRLSREKAEAAIQRRVAARLGIGTGEAARAIRETVEGEMADRLRQFLEARGQHAAECVLFAFGGAGPLHACRIAERIGLGKILTFPFGSVFGAFGASTTDLLHRYLRALPPESTRQQASQAEAELRRRALQDMAGEGFGADAFRITRELREETLIITATAPIPHWGPPTLPRSGGDPAAALKGQRGVTWDRSGPRPTPVYSRPLLRPGDRLAGPALVEAADTTCAIPPGWRYTVNDRGGGLLEPLG